MLHIICSVLSSLQRPYLLLLLLQSLPSNRIFTIMYLKQTMILGYNVAAVLSSQYLTQYYFPWCIFCAFALVLHEVCLQCLLWLFSAVPWCALPVCYSGIVWMISRWLQLALLLLVSSIFTFHIHCIYILRYLYFKIFLASFLATFLSPAIVRSINDTFLFQIIFKWHIPIVQISLYIYGIYHHPTTLSIIYNGYCFGLLFRPSWDYFKWCMVRWWPE